MASRLGAGPVFGWELVAGTRRWQPYALKAVFVAALLVWLSMIWSRRAGQTYYSAQQLASVGREFFAGLVVIQLTLVLLAAPAATAGAVCLDKARGTLLHVLVTDLTAGEIVLGKLAARLAPVLGLVACGLPVVALCGLFGGLEAEAVVGAYLVTFAVAIVGCTLALTLSVWARKTHQALVGTYLIESLWVGAFFFLATVFRWRGPVAAPGGPMELALSVNPYGMALIPIWGIPTPLKIDLRLQGAYLGAACLLAWALFAVARRTIRPTVLAQANRPARRDKPEMPARIVRRLPEPPLDGNPVLWREWHRKLPSRWVGRFWAIYTVVSFLASALVVAAYYIAPGDWYYGGWNGQFWASQVNAWQVAIGLLLLSVSAATALAEERDQGNLELVMATPLSTSTIFWGKWWGAFAMVPRLSILPIWVGAALAMITSRGLAFVLMVGLILAYAAAITSLGLALATWIPRLGRVVSTSTIAYVLVSVGWPILLLEVTNWRFSDRATWLAVSSASPFLGIYTMTGLSGRLGFANGYGSGGITD
ncbi:MAG TPA: ABC transporter permease, partial [Isosphaeraceae bacterium]|nr:ABC transporter permease [Isosphaeraceae bacterium]